MKEMNSALAVVSVMFLAAAISGVALVSGDNGRTNQAQASFIGTTPDTSTEEPQPPTF
jgi:hypothetical protein